jgi:hypothetical protein
MPRSKTLHVVNATLPVENRDNPTTLHQMQVDFALSLSKTLGRNIRQGHTFRVVGVGASLTHRGANDADTGMAVAVQCRYVPTNRHGVKAWQQMFAKWSRQKRLSGKIGQYVKYDDFELAFEPTHISSRTSAIFAGGMGDTTSESIALLGTASSGNHTTLQDMYNSYQPIDGAGTDEFGVSIKSPKFSTHFPEPAALYLTAHLSSIPVFTDLQDAFGDTGEVDSQSVHLTGGSSSDGLMMLPADNHLNVMAGLVQVNAYVLPPDIDTGDQPPTADDFDLNMTFLIEGWSPLSSKPKKRTMKRKTTKRRTTKRRR